MFNRLLYLVGRCFCSGVLYMSQHVSCEGFLEPPPHILHQVLLLPEGHRYKKKRLHLWKQRLRLKAKTWRWWKGFSFNIFSSTTCIAIYYVQSLSFDGHQSTMQCNLSLCSLARVRGCFLNVGSVSALIINWTTHVLNTGHHQYSGVVWHVTICHSHD